MSNHTTLVNKYNRLDALNQDLTQQLKDRIKESATRQAKADHTESLARDLCKLILAKDPAEMVLGQAYSWSNVEVDELINKSIKTFKEYNDGQTILLKRLIDDNESRRETIENLTKALEASITNSGTGETKPGTEPAPKSVEAAVKQIEKEKEHDETVKKLSHEHRKAVEEGKIELIIEEDSDTSLMDIADYGESVAMSGILETNRKEIPVHPAYKKQKEKEKRKKEEEEAINADITEINKRMGQLGWYAFSAIGKHGISEYKRIVEKVQQLHEADDADNSKKNLRTESRIRIAVGEMVALGVIALRTTVDLKGKSARMYHITPIGSKVYKEKYSDTPAISELDKLLAGTKELEQEYGVSMIAVALKNNSAVSKVETGKEIDAGGGAVYKADIACVLNSKDRYFTYERGTKKQAMFNAYYSRVCKVTDEINIVVGANALVDTLTNQIESWINSRGGHKAMVTKTVKIINADKLSGDLSDESNWALIWKLGETKPAVRI